MSHLVGPLRDALGDRFAVERALGQGGMGAVYLARDRQLERAVAIKVLPPEFAQRVELRERFLRETRVTAGFSHPNIVPVFSIEAHGDLLAYVMGFVEGETLAELVRRVGPLPVRDVVRMLQDIGYALAYAHGRGVVHRDLKPDNIMIERATGRALLMDFGISRSVSAGAVPARAAGATALTRVGEVVGTPEFMSPEQASGDDVDGRSDLYALGLVAWFALAGESAMQGESTQKVLVRQLTETVPPVHTRRSDVPTPLSEVIARCVEKAPEARFANAEALIEALDAGALRGGDVPLPVRLFAEELSKVSQVLVFSAILIPVVYQLLASWGRGALDVVLPVVLIAAIAWGRLAQALQQARGLLTRGFTPAAIRSGFAALRAERDAERAQLRATPTAVLRRRRQVVSASGFLALSFALRAWVVASMRTEVRPGWYQVSLPGVIILYAAYVMRGVSIVQLVRSPLRPSLGERLFAVTWAGAPGQWLLRALGTGLGLPSRGGVTVPPTQARTPVTAAPGSTPVRSTPATATPVRSAPTSASTARVARENSGSLTEPAAPSHASGADGTARIEALDARVRALEAWRARAEPNGIDA
ncbi:MAG: protein kinase [Gemmatimonadetes bacterium]|nr:protein kinase [Gemmatimonadota bacterium]